MSLALEMSKAALDMTTTCTTWTVGMILRRHFFLLTPTMEAATHGSTSQFAAKVGMNFKIPALMLEDVEHHIESVGCYSSEIHLHFRSAELLKRAHNEFARAKNFLVVTSHRGCNEDGERNPHV